MTKGHWKFSDVNSNKEHEWRLDRHEINLNLENGAGHQIQRNIKAWKFKTLRKGFNKTTNSKDGTNEEN